MVLGKILVIAEKPSVGRDIARVLQCKIKGEGCLIGESYIVSWAIGHLVTLCEPEEYDTRYKKWAFSTLPIIPENIKLKPIKKTLPQLKILKKLMNDKETDSIICATDSGREGELIFRYIYTIVQCKKKVQRLWISSMTDIAIQDGFRHLKSSTEYDKLYLCAKCRSEADWLVGINATRAFTIKYNALLSIGRVQTPTLAIMTARQKEIDSFEVKDYYEVQNQYGNFNGIWFEPKDGNTKIFEKEKADEICKKVLQKTGFVEKVEKELKKQPHPLLYDLTELQRDCNKRYGFSAQKTLSLAQDLYEKRKLITYPRTDSRYLSDDMKGKIQAVLNQLEKTEYQKYVQYVLSLEKLPLTKRILDNSKVTDHHAIIPTDGSIKTENLTAEEKKVFQLIALRFLAVFYKEYSYTVTKITTCVEEERFLSKGTIIVQYGWMELYKDLKIEKSTKKQPELEQMLPELKKGETVKVESSQVLKKKTQPPPQYTEASLLSAMENAGRFVEEEALKEQLKESGLGTPATRAAIIERLISVGYIVRKGKSLQPTQKGMQLTEIVPLELKSPQTTGKWEKGLSSISKGDMTEERFMGSIKRYVMFLIQQSQNINTEVVFEAEQRRGTKAKKNGLGKCPLCGKGSIYENTKAFFCSQWQDGCKFTIWKSSLERYGNELTADKIKKLLKNKKIEDLAITMPQTGEKCKAELILKEDNSGMVELKNVERLP